jgi:hypothetical protein
MDFKEGGFWDADESQFMSISFDSDCVGSLLMLTGSELSCGAGKVVRSPAKSEADSGDARGRARIEPTDFKAEGFSEAEAGANMLMSISFDMVCVASLLLMAAAAATASTGACDDFSGTGHKRLIA